VIGDEPRLAYDRVLLSSVLAGETAPEAWQLKIGAVTGVRFPRRRRRPATQNLAHSHWNGTSVQSWIWLGSEGPVVFATAKGGPRRCVLDARIIIAAAGFKQENADIGVLGQSPRHHRP